jgi:hypothetical protein
MQPDYGLQWFKSFPWDCPCCDSLYGLFLRRLLVKAGTFAKEAICFVCRGNAVEPFAIYHSLTHCMEVSELQNDTATALFMRV